MATRRGHERRCPYLLLLDTWENPDDSDGEWAVEQILDVRRSPERRFWKLLWAPYTDEERDVHAQARRSGPDDGLWRHGWQPAANYVRLGAMQRTFWSNNRGTHDPLSDYKVWLRNSFRRVLCVASATTSSTTSRHLFPLSPASPLLCRQFLLQRRNLCVGFLVCRQFLL